MADNGIGRSFMAARCFLFFVGAVFSVLPVQADVHIDHLSRAKAAPGGTVTIYGSGFGDQSGYILVSGLRHKPVSWSADRVTFRLSQDAASGFVCVRDATASLSNKVPFTVKRALPEDQFAPHNFVHIETGLPGASFLVETDGGFLYGIGGFETLTTYRIRNDAPYEFSSRLYLPQRVGDIRIHGGYLFCAGDHGLFVFRCSDLQNGGADPVAVIAGASFMAVDIKEKEEGALVALCQYKSSGNEDALQVPLYLFSSEELRKVGEFTRTAGRHERQHAIALDPRNAKVYVSGFETLFGADKYLLEIDISDPARPVLNHREETESILLFDLDARKHVLWAGLHGTGTETFRSYYLRPGAEHLALKQQVHDRFQFGKTTRIKIIDDSVTAGSAWLGARPDVFLLKTFGSETAPDASFDSVDWAFDVTGCAEGAGSGKVIVADEWAGFLTYEYEAGSECTLTCEHDCRMVVGGAMTEGIHIAGDRLYIAGRGAGVWSADRFDLANEDQWKHVAWNWDDDKPQPHPISALCTRNDPVHGTLIAALGKNKAMAWGEYIYGILYRETTDNITRLAISDAIDPPGLYSSGISAVWAEEDLVFITTGTDGIRAYVVDPDAPAIFLHTDCLSEGFCRDVFSASNMAICMALYRTGGQTYLVAGSKPELFSSASSLHLFTVDYPEGPPTRGFPDRPIVIHKTNELVCMNNMQVDRVRINDSGMIAAATNQGIAVFHISWIPELNAMNNFQAWNSVKVPASSYGPWWNSGWNVVFKDVAFCSGGSVYAVKAPFGIWKIDLEFDEEHFTHESTCSGYYPGVHCGMDYGNMLHGWADPDIVTLHHPYGVAADGRVVYVTGWSGKIDRLLYTGGSTTLGDVNDDGRADVADAVTLLAYLFMGGELQVAPGEADLNGDAAVDVSDVVWLLQYLFT